MWIGMHIRHGDKRSAAQETAHYHAAARTLQNRYGVRHIFLATDDTSAARACRLWEGFTCVVFRGVSEHNSGHLANAYGQLRGAPSGRNTSEDTLRVLLDVDTLARCDFFVGAFASSQVSTAAYELLVARRGGHVPFVNFGHWHWGDDGFAR